MQPAYSLSAYRLLILVALLMLCCIAEADAQTIGLGGGGGGTGLITFLLGILDVVFGLAILFCGIMVMRGHGEWMMVAFVALGILIAEHWQDILNALKAGA